MRVKAIGKCRVVILLVAVLYVYCPCFLYLHSFNNSNISSLDICLQQPGRRKQVSAAWRSTSSSVMPISLQRVGKPISLMNVSKASMPLAAIVRSSAASAE